MRALMKPATWVLLAANLIPLAGVLLWGWDAFVLLILYWLETVVIAFWTVLRIATMRRGSLDELQLNDQRGPVSPIGMAAFFTLHAGIFMGVHFMFLWTLFSGEWSKKIHGVGAFIDQLVIGTDLWIPLAVLFCVHGALMGLDAVRPMLWRGLGLVEITPARKPLLGPAEGIVFGLYVRIFVMQVTIILGAWVALLFGSAGALAFLILVKTAMEVSFDMIVERVVAATAAAKAKAEMKG